MVKGLSGSVPHLLTRISVLAIQWEAWIELASKSHFAVKLFFPRKYV